MNAVKKALCLTVLIGCLFHFKQAIRRHMVTVIQFTTGVASFMMDVIDVLTIIPPEEVATKGLWYVLSKFDLDEDSDKWYHFVKYMFKTWIDGYYAIADWNVYACINKDRSV